MENPSKIRYQIPGYYYDERQCKYFKILPDHQKFVANAVTTARVRHESASMRHKRKRADLIKERAMNRTKHNMLNFIMVRSMHYTSASSQYDNLLTRTIQQFEPPSLRLCTDCLKSNVEGNIFALYLSCSGKDGIPQLGVVSHHAVIYTFTQLPLAVLHCKSQDCKPVKKCSHLLSGNAMVCATGTSNPYFMIGDSITVSRITSKLIFSTFIDNRKILIKEFEPTSSVISLIDFNYKYQYVVYVLDQHVKFYYIYGMAGAMEGAMTGPLGFNVDKEDDYKIKDRLKCIYVHKEKRSVYFGLKSLRILHFSHDGRRFTHRKLKIKLDQVPLHIHQGLYERDNNHLFVGDCMGQIYLYKISTGEKIMTYSAPSNAISSFRFDFDSTKTIIYSVGSDSYVRVWKVNSGRLLSTIVPNGLTDNPSIVPTTLWIGHHPSTFNSNMFGLLVACADVFTFYGF